MTELTVLKFEELELSRPSLRGKGFGVRGQAYVNLYGRGPWLIECETGDLPEQMIRLEVGAHGSFGLPSFVHPEFRELPEGSPLKDFNMLYMSNDGTDQWPPVNHYTGEPEPRGPECALSRNTKYGFFIPAIVGGHPSQKPGIRFGYASRSSDDLDSMLLEIPMPLMVNGVMLDGVWHESPPEE